MSPYGSTRVRSILSASGTHDLTCVGAHGVEPLRADVRGATPWRARLGIPEPSRQLEDALSGS